MGNGAAVGAGNRKLLLNFEYVESLARRGHFHKNVTDYKDAVEECIRSGEMDVLEILIPAGNAQRILPLHIAARLGSLESCELLISAGFDYFAVDTLGRTPLHLCPLNISDEAILCTTLLGLKGPKAVNIRDKDRGNTPLHIAVENNNIKSVACLLNIKGINSTLPNREGYTATDLAKKYRHTDIFEMLLGNGKNGGDKDLKKKAKSKEEEAVDTERIMQVWGAFFENAMRQVEVEEGLTMDDEGCQALERTVKSEYHSSAQKRQLKRYDSDNDDDDENYLPSPHRDRNKDRDRDIEEKDQCSYFPPHTDHTTLTSTPTQVVKSHDDYEDYEADSRVLAWLDWICCYDTDTCELYVQNVTDGTTAWMADHLYSQQYWYGLIPSEWNQNLDSYLSLPADTFTLVEYGWISFYDSVSNECYWYNIPSQQSLSCLPIGGDHLCNSPWGLFLGLDPYEGSNEWRVSPHRDYCKNSWVAVIINNNESNNEDNKNTENESVFYYLNKFTGYTSWTQPDGWNQLVQGPWNGWILCTNEEASWIFFWWNPDTNESIWVE